MGAILGSVIQIFVFRFKDQFDFVLDLHRYNNRLLPRLRMKMRRLFLIGGILALAGIIALDVFVFVTKEANPNLMIKSLLASYGIDIEFSADASLLDKAGEVFFVVSVISIVCNCLALFAFTAAVVVDTGSERDRRIKYSRSLGECPNLRQFALTVVLCSYCRVSFDYDWILSESNPELH